MLDFCFLLSYICRKNSIMTKFKNPAPIKNPRLKARLYIIHDLFLDIYYVGSSAPELAKKCRIVTGHAIRQHAKESELKMVLLSVRKARSTQSQYAQTLLKGDQEDEFIYY